MDRITAARRSRNMSRIRSQGTTPEQRLYKIVRKAAGRRITKRNVKELPGQPDLLIPSLRIVIFADGCFFHSCPDHGHLPKSNARYWKPKLARNQMRDARSRRRLRRMGYSVWRVWEHDLALKRLHLIARFLNKRIEKEIDMASQHIVRGGCKI